MTARLDSNGAFGDGRGGIPWHSGVCDGATITPRQRELLPLVCRGLSNKQMATDLNVSEDDIEYLVRELLGRSGCRNRAQLAAWAVEHRLGDSGIP